jgi:hypothetical protein
LTSTIQDDRILEMMERLQQENQRIMKLLEKSVPSINNDCSRSNHGAADPSWLTSERRELLEMMIGEICTDKTDAMEQQAILASLSTENFIYF